MTQKINMADTVIRAGIAYSFYAVPYSLPAIKKLDKKIIALHKTICGIPKCTSNIATQLPHNLFGIEAFSLKNAYLRCIGEQLQHALNDTGRLGAIYNGLLQFILAKFGGSEGIPRIKYHQCVRSPITRTLFLLKQEAGVHLKSTMEKNLISTSPLENAWMKEAQNIHNLNPKTSLKLLQKLLLHNILKLEQITLPNGLHLMSPSDFKNYHSNPTKLIKSALNIAQQLFCHPSCPPQCQQPCTHHYPPRTLKDNYIIINHNILPRQPEPPTHPPSPPHPRQPIPPRNILTNSRQFPIHIILGHKQRHYIDPNGITRNDTSYLCQWITQNNAYNKWRTQRDLFPWYDTHTCIHNIKLLTQYYTQEQHKHYSNLISAHFATEQRRDTRYVTPTTIMPLVHISIHECNPESDIETNTSTIQTQLDVAHIYEDNGRHLITIPKTRLDWLWKQYQLAKDLPHGLEPTTQSFETEIVWLYQRYKYRIPKNDPLKLAQYTLPTPILNFLTTTFNVRHSYFSSPVTCPIHLNQFYSPFTRDKIFGSLGKAFDHKWKGIGYAHPNNIIDLQQAIHWARLAAKNDANTITILISPDNNWYQNCNPYSNSFPDTHIIAHFAADTITYEEPTIPPELNMPRKEPSAIQILCIHHQNNDIGTYEQLNQLTQITSNLSIQQPYIQTATHTPPNTSVNPSKKWSKLTYPNTPMLNEIHVPQIPNYQTNLPLKFHPQFSYYTDGSFKKPKEILPGTWRREKAGYGIYSPKGINIAKRLHGHQNILRAEMIAIHETIRIINTQFPNEPAYIFTDSLNVLYLLNTQIKYPTLHNSHPDQVTLASMVQLLQTRSQPITLYKIRAHINIDGNERADTLAKEGLDLPHENAIYPFEHAHATPYYYQKDKWPSMIDTLDKGPVRFLEKQITKYDKTNLEIMATQTPNIHKWTSNADIDKELSNEFWTNPNITDKQKSCLIKFRTGTYMGQARKQLFFGRQRYPTITCPICNSYEPDTWLHVLLKCRQQHIHSLHVKRHNKAVWEIRKLLISSEKSRCYILMNAGTFNNNPQENTVPNWLLPCTCRTQRCHCNARFRPDILCVKGLPYQNEPPTTTDQNLTIQFIEFTYCNDRFSP